MVNVIIIVIVMEIFIMKIRNQKPDLFDALGQLVAADWCQAAFDATPVYYCTL